MALMTFEQASSGWDLEEPEQSVIGGFWMEGDSLAPPCQTDMDIVKNILEFANITKNDKVFDLGCGDGRICALASKMYGCRSCGAEIEENLVRKFRSNIETNLSADHEKGLVSVYAGDLRELDVSDATIIILYLLPESIAEITSSILVPALMRGAVLICNTWGPHALTPIDQIVVGPYNNVKVLKYDKTSVCPPLPA
jgi:hypothetical protein